MARSVFNPPNVGDRAEGLGDAPERRAPITRRKPIVKGGAASDKYIRAATQGGADRTYQEIPVEQISESRIRDRIDVNEDIESLAESIRESGQQIPILVRVVQGDLPYEIVVGRRRLAAARSLGHNRIKAFVSKMNEREAFIAQGIENTERLETSYIERARAAYQAVELGYEQQDVAKFLGISKSLMSFMLKSYKALTEDLVLAIGPARGVGRRKWDALITAMEKQGLRPADVAKLVDPEIEDSVARFEALLLAVQSSVKQSSQPPAPAQTMRRDFLGGDLSTLRKSRQLVVKTRSSVPDDVLERIHSRIEEVVAEYEAEKRNGG